MTNRVKFDINTDDAHVDDLVARVRLKSFFKAEQKRRLEYDKDVAKRVNRGGNWLHSTWRNEHWLLSTMQVMARAFDLELGFEPKMPHSVWLKLDKSELWQLSQVFAANPDAEKRDEAARIDLCVLGGKIRNAMGIEDYAFAKKLNTDRSKLLDWEQGGRPHYTVTAVQRHFRLLGAPLRLHLINPAAAAAGSEEATFDLPACKEEAGRATAWLLTNSVNIVEDGDEVLVFNGLRDNEMVRFPAAVWHEWVTSGSGRA